MGDSSVRAQQEGSRYALQGELHDLPAIQQWFSTELLRPYVMSRVGHSSFEELAIDEINRMRLIRPGSRTTIVSLGAGHAQIEARILELLQQAPIGNVDLYALDLFAPGDVVESSADGYNYRLVRQVVDLNRVDELLQCEVVFAHHSLHHFAALERVFQLAHAALSGSQGPFLISDMVGRNGHMRWPETWEAIDRIWMSIPSRYKHNHQLDRFDRFFDNWDCSREGFEGIRSQDILKCLSRWFMPVRAAWWGGLTDVFVDRSYGPNLNPETERDQEFLRGLWTLERSLSERQLIWPTQVLGVFGLASASNATASSQSLVQVTRCTHNWVEMSDSRGIADAVRSWLGDESIDTDTSTLSRRKRLCAPSLPEDVFHEGWASPESQLRWGVGRRSRLRINAGRKPLLGISIEGQVAPGAAEVTISLIHPRTGANAKGKIQEGTMTLRTPMNLEGMWDIVIECESPMPVAAPDADARPLSFALRSIELF